MKQFLRDAIDAILIMAVIIFLLFQQLANEDGVTGATELSKGDLESKTVELVYEGEKPDGVGSVQSFAITDDYFVVATRPKGTAAGGGEDDNQLIVIDRKSLEDVTDNFLAATETYELGHANGMTYDPVRDELLVVSVRDNANNYQRVAHIDADTFGQVYTEDLPCLATGITYVPDKEKFVVRAADQVCILDEKLDNVIVNYIADTPFAKQDIGYDDGYVYLATWAGYEYYGNAGLRGYDIDDNVIFKYSLDGELQEGYYLEGVSDELESVDFVDGEMYILLNGSNSFFRNGYFGIYRVV